METKIIQLNQITDRVIVRSIKPKGVERIKQAITQIGYLPEKPMLVTGDGNGGYILVGGNHRYEALTQMGVNEAPMLIDDSLITDSMRLARARQTNEATEVLVPTTFVDDAEFVWKQAAVGMTQNEIGAILGWSREKVSQYAMLQKICLEAWKIIATSFEDGSNYNDNSDGSSIATSGSIFSERLLRSILSLTPPQQLELISKLINDPNFGKKQFTDKAQVYKIRNEIRAYVLNQLTGIPPEFIEPRLTDIDQGGYDSDWIIQDKPKLAKFIEAIREEYEEKSGTKIIFGDFNQEVLEIADSSIDLILTDIPYNISNQGKVTKQGSQIVNAVFDDDEHAWDTVSQEDYDSMFEDWSKQWYRILRPGGNLIVWGDKPLMLGFWRIFQTIGLIPKSIIVWEKSNPSPAGLARKGLVSAAEFMIWAIKPGESYTFNSSPNWNRSNVIHGALCQGDERLKKPNGDTLHPTQKPQAVIRPLVEVFSNRGDLIFDGFSGVGSTGKAALELGRKFIGIEIKSEYFKAMGDWLNVS